MICFIAYFNKIDLITLGYFQANGLQRPSNYIGYHFLAIFYRQNNVIK